MKHDLLKNLPEAGTLDVVREDSLCTQIALDNEDALNELVLANMREGFLYTKHCSRRMEIPDDELFSLVYAALRTNAVRYAALQKRTVRFFAYAKAGLRGAAKDFWPKQDVVKNSSVHDLESIEKWWKNQQTSSTELLDAGYLADWNIMPAEALVKTPEPHTDPEFDLITMRAQISEMNGIIKSVLTEQEAMVVDLLYVAGFNCVETGELLSISRSAVQQIHARALKKLRKAVDRKPSITL